MQKGGAQRVMALLSTYLSKDYQVFLINDSVPSTDYEEYSIPEGVQRLFLDERGHKSFKQIRRIFRLRHYIKKMKPCLILSFMASPNIRMILSTFCLKIKRIISVRNDPYYEYGSGLKRFVANHLFGKVDGCVFQTIDASLYFKEGIRKKSKIIVNPVDSRFFETTWTGKSKYVLSVGRLEEQKNYPLLFDAFQIVLTYTQKYRLRICGRGTQETFLKSYAMKKKIFEYVDFIGEVNDVEKELSSASLFVLSSKFEGLPNALMEAMAVGVPCISTDCPCGGPKMLLVNNSGLLVDNNNPRLLADAIISLLDNAEKKELLHKNALERSRSFSLDSVMIQWKEYIESIINS